MGARTPLETLADVLSSLMPRVGVVPGDEWKTAKLYAPHVAKVLVELHASGQQQSAATVHLLLCSVQYADVVLLDYQQELWYG